MPESIGNIAAVFDALQDGLTAAAGVPGAIPEFVKLGNFVNLLQIGIHAGNGEPENVAQDIGVMAASVIGCAPA